MGSSVISLSAEAKQVTHISRIRIQTHDKNSQLDAVNITVEATVGRVAGCRSKADLKAGTTDALVKPLKVKPEGVPVEVVESEFRCMRGAGSKKRIKMRKLSLPLNTVADSGRAWVHITGDIMAPSLDNLGNLVRQPTGCGEQNMIGLVPNIYLLNYLEATKQKNEELEKKAKEYMKIGYDRQANYHHENGAYSVWGEKRDSKKEEGSSWLTAFVVRSFSEAANYISVESNVVQKSVDWLLESQEESGCFRKIGYVHHGASLT